MTKTKEMIENESYEILEKRTKISELEQFYVDATISNLPEIVEKRKEETVNKLQEFQEKYVSTREDKMGNEIKVVNPYLISTYFFKTINPFHTKVPQYSAEKLAIVWELYMYLVEQVNMNIAPFNPTISHFCKFAGITLYTFNSYKVSGNEDLMIICQKICDETMSGNFEMAQHKMLNEKTTMTRLKVENEIVEKSQPKVIVNINEEIDKDIINKRINKYREFTDKRKIYNE